MCLTTKLFCVKSALMSFHNISVLQGSLVPEWSAEIPCFKHAGALARYPSGLELRVLDLDGGNSRVLSGEPDIFGGPICWSPDGRQVLFARFNDKNAAIKPDREPPGDIFTIWSIGRDGTNLRRLTTGWCPDWRNR